jgi:hypothetical protein
MKGHGSKALHGRPVANTERVRLLGQNIINRHDGFAQIKDHIL